MVQETEKKKKGQEVLFNLSFSVNFQNRKRFPLEFK